MSYVAIGSVTKAVVELLTKKLNKPQLMGAGTFRVTSLPPDDDRVNEENGLNVFLYRVAESPFAKNMDWRGDRLNPVQGNRPPLALMLSYLITAYAKKTAGTTLDEITAHQLLGDAMAILHEYPVLNDIHDADFDADLDSQFPPELRDSFEKIKLSLLPITMEEFSKIWTGFSKAYRLSVAYEASLLEIGPSASVPPPGPPVQQTALGVNTITPPSISSIEPHSGPAGAQVTIKGQGFKQPGGATQVSVGDTDFAAADLVSLSPQEIQLKIPEAPQGGPKLAITVTAGGGKSAAGFYTVSPWISMVTPLRGITGVPLVIPIKISAGAALSVEIDGQTTTTTVDPSGQFVTAIVPQTIASNGPKTVVLILNGGAPKRSNARIYEVLPRIQSVQFATTPTPPSTTITVTGERLNGTDTGVQLGGLLIGAGKNANANQLVAQVSRVFTPGNPVTAIVDGRVSNVLPPVVDQIDPQQGFRGDAITLTGKGLSGRNVTVSFGGVTVNLGAQALSGRLLVTVPAGLAPGVIQVKATSDGNDTNSLPFRLLG